MNELASIFPNSRFTGIDLAERAVDAARAEASRRGLENVRFEAQDAAAMTAIGEYDLITAFDAVHDQARPAAVLRNINRALRRSGTFLMQDISGSSHVHEDVAHPLGPFLYAISCMHCMSVSLAAGGPGLGAMWGKELALKMLGEAGFGRVDVETLPHDPMNYFYIVEAGS
jgi:SAM-dependent methyltransferase